jgi:heptosyltransferase-2/heptosyltransferase-3
VLLIRPDHVGDLLLMAPAVARLRQALPSARITYLVGPWSREVAEHGPPVDAVRVLAYPGFTRAANANLLAPYALLLAEAARLRRDRFDLAIVFRPDHWWGALLTACAGIPVRVGADTPETTPLLTHTRRVSTAEHAADQALALASLALRACGVEAATDRGAPSDAASPSGAGAPSDAASPSGAGALRDTDSPSDADAPSNAGHPSDADALRDAEPASTAVGALFRVSDGARAAATELWQLHALDGRQVVAIQASAGAALKSWPVGHWAALADRLAGLAPSAADPRPLAVVLTGGPADAPLLADVQQRMANVPAAVLAGQSLDVTAAVFERCQLVIGLDGGAAHLAGALGTPTIRLYGPASADVFGPWPRAQKPQVVLMTHALDCVPCGHLEAPPCGARTLPACLLAIEVDAVVELARQQLARV